MLVTLYLITGLWIFLVVVFLIMVAMAFSSKWGNRRYVIYTAEKGFLKIKNNEIEWVKKPLFSTEFKNFSELKSAVDFIENKNLEVSNDV